MQTLYRYDERRVFTGATMQIADGAGAQLGWTRTAPPELASGEFAVFKGRDGWRVVDIEPAFPPPPVPQAVPALAALLALDAAGLASAYDAWANDPARTFAERAFINKALTWERGSPVIQSAADALELTGAQLDQLFITADQLLETV